MFSKLSKLSFLSLIVSLFVCAQVRAQQSPAITRRHNDRQLKWNPCPPIFPKGCKVTILHRDPATGRSDVFLRLASNVRLPRHWHTSPEHMILVAGTLRVTYDGQRPSVLRPGTYAYGPAKASHEARCAAGPCVLFIAFESPVDAELTIR